jgi:type VI secretion system protein ImpI/type VI secretion system protein
MATLSLTLLGHPEFGGSGRRQVHSGELTVGRGAECDWALPDPMKSLSRKHCRLVCSASAWQVQDLSTNGTFVNAVPEPIGPDLVQVLRDGDRLRLGDYEIEVRFVEQTSPFVGRPDGLGQAANPFGEPVAPGFAAARLPGLDDPPEFNLPSGGDRTARAQGAFADHGASSSDAFVPPRVLPPGKAIVPDDWLSEFAVAASPAASSPSMPTAPIPSAFSAFDVVPAAPAAPRPSPRPADVPLRPPALPAGEPVRADISPPPPVDLSSGRLLPAAAACGDLNAALAALISGANLPPEIALRAAEDPEGVLRNAGALLSVAVSGVRALLIGRGMVKREFRIEQTMLHTKENNPLKFAASDEQALTALLDPRTRSLHAMQESIDDLTSHQVAVLAATQSAARALLQRLEPSALEAEDTGGRKFLDSREKRLWDTYKRRHAKLLEQFEDDFESAFGTAFARAYEQAVDKGTG